ncbi:MAG: HAMP domain-containing protein [Anaerolineales bacterium]|nr:HAMP domain-containing protein [Anaerolineales bacterium]
MTRFPFWQTLWFKLTVAFLAVSLTAVVVSALLINQLTANRFQAYLAQDEQAQLDEMAATLSAYYARTGSWTGVDAVLGSLRPAGMGNGQGMGGRLVVLDAEGTAVAGMGMGRRNQADLSEGTPVPLVVGGEQVGTLLVMGMMGMSGQAEQFLQEINQAMWLTAVVAMLLPLVLGPLLARWLARPIAEMNTAVQALAGGDTAVQVTTISRDELGQLAASFNQMSAALALNEQQRQQLLADTAHELRTPITVLQTHLEAMLDGVFDVSPENLAAVHEEVLLLGRLVNDLRTLSLAEAGQLPLTPTAVDLGQLVNQTVMAFQPLAELEGVLLEIEGGGEDTAVWADGGRIQQVLNNLLANALRHVPAGTGHIRVSLATEGAGVRVAVADNGPGLSPQMQAQVFDRFWKGDVSRQRVENGGSGLGLTICRAIIELHHGRVGVISREGEGATFYFWLPCGSPESPELH